MKNFSSRIPEINSWLLAAVFFTIPIQVAPAYVISAIILVLFLLEGRFGEKISALRREPLVWIFPGYFLVFALSLAWTDDLEWGSRMVRRQMFFLLFPFYFLVSRREHFPRYLAAFLVSVALCEVLAYYNFFQIHVWRQLPEGIKVDKDPLDAAPFVDRILYTPVLAFAGYLAAHQLLFHQGSRRLKALYAALFFATAGNLLFSGGRAGLVGFLVMLLVIAFQRFPRHPVVTGVAALGIISAFLIGGYFSNDYFRARIDVGIADIGRFQEKPATSAVERTSVGERITFVMNSSRIIAANPVLGVGVGDFPDEYDKINQLHSPTFVTTWNPHNQYMYAVASAGIPGGMMLMLVLLYPLLRQGNRDGREHMRVALPILFLTICLGESYLLRSNTSLMYVLFTAALWRNGERVRK